MTLSSLTAWHSVILIKTQIFPVAKIFFSIHFPFALWFLFFTVHIHPHSDLHFVSGPKRAKWLAHSPCPWTSRLFGPMPFVLHEPWWNISNSFRVLFSSDVGLELGQSPAHQQNGDIASPSSWSSDLVTFFLMPCCFSRLEGAYSHLEWILLVSQWCSDNFKHSLKQFFFSFPALFFFFLKPCRYFLWSFSVLLPGTWFERKTSTAQWKKEMTCRAVPAWVSLDH